MDAGDLDEVMMRDGLCDIASRDCQWDGDGRDDGEPCDCGPCVAKRALASISAWRFRGAMASRQDNGLHPAEERMMAAFRDYMQSGRGPDERLAQVLHEGTTPTRRDWFVASSVVQWLATNVGSSVIRAAGYEYKMLAEDRAAREAVLPSTLRGRAPSMTTLAHRARERLCLHCGAPAATRYCTPVCQKNGDELGYFAMLREMDIQP